MSTPKRPRSAISEVRSTSKTPTQILLDLKHDKNKVESGKALRALCSCVISAASGEDDTIYLNCLEGK